MYWAAALIPLCHEGNILQTKEKVDVTPFLNEWSISFNQLFYQLFFYKVLYLCTDAFMCLTQTHM